MADNARGIHVSPGIYTREIDINYAIRSLGITTLGLAGETIKGPAFQAMDISNWREFQEVFGGTSTEKFKGSQYPKYELPYIAKSYLTESEQLKVVRILGLSGYNAGPAWIVTASKSHQSGETPVAVAVIRSRGTYRPYSTSNSNSADCICETSKYDVLRYYVGEKISKSSGGTCPKAGYNKDALQIKPYVPMNDGGNECIGYNMSSGSSSFAVSQFNHGRFKLIGVTGIWDDNSAFTTVINDGYSGSTTQKEAAFKNGYFEYSVSLNPSDKEYILNVLGTTPYDGDAPIFVESLYDVALDQAIAEGMVGYIDSGATSASTSSGDTELAGLKFYQVYYTADFCHHEPVSALMTIPQSSLRRKNVGQRFLADSYSTSASTSGVTGLSLLAVPYDYSTNKPLMVKDASGDTKLTNLIVNTLPSNIKSDSDEAKTWSATTMALVPVVEGQIYTVKQYTEASGKRNYHYAYYYKGFENISGKTDIDMTNIYGNLLSGGTSCNTKNESSLVLNNSDGLYYRMASGSTTALTVTPVTLDMNDYKSAYRFASTPWIVSNLKGDFTHAEINKLFRFHTHSDGKNANYEVKVSIENIRPDEGVFDVVVRNVYDTDESIIPLERFGRCSMIPGTSNYIAFKIGSYDGVYESKSKYITVEVNETTAAKMSVPAGFIGYPIPQYGGTPISGGTHNIAFPTLKYNRFYDPDIKNRKQYFGLSSWVGVDIDNFTFKGNKAYIEDPSFLSRGFHLDSRLDRESGGAYLSAYTVDGEAGYEFDAVSTNSRTATLSEAPIIGTEADMYGSIYEYVNLRKFTVYFYGGFDGWDDYRDQRTNTDEFKMTQYRGYINQGSGEGYSFNKIVNPDILGLNQNGITSDWYAYLAGIRQFSNPEATDINVFATPGIDYVSQKLLVEETIDMIEEERADSIYVVTTPDKPAGAGDYFDEMYTPEEAVYNLEDTEIDSNYTCTYYPWVKYLDQDNNQYIYLPATKDAVRNFAQTDNTAYPWFAPAGIERGNVDCVRAHFITKIGDEDALYEGRINPIKTFAQDGPKIWGQKNLQINESQLNRIAVRRLLLRMRKLIAISCIGLIFEPNDPTTKQAFLSTVTPIMDNIRSNRGISDYRIEVNDTIESRERRELPAKIYFKPYNALEYIVIDFILTPEGIDFADI
jgi:hypothetical protein